MPLHPAMTGHLQAVTQDAERLREWWAPDGALEFPYATADMTSRIEGVDRLVAYFGGARRWRDWRFDEVNTVDDAARRMYVAEIHASATWIETGAAYEQDYVIWWRSTGTAGSSPGARTGTGRACSAVVLAIAVPLALEVLGADCPVEGMDYLNQCNGLATAVMLFLFGGVIVVQMAVVAAVYLLIIRAAGAAWHKHR